MIEQTRLFEAGPDPFGRMWKVQFRWLQTGISIRHADTVDVKFLVTSDGGVPEEKVIAIPNRALLELSTSNNRKISDPLCMRLAALHLRHMIETTEDMDKTLVEVSREELFSYDRELNRVTDAAHR